MSQDLEVLEESMGAHRGPIKIQVMGPLTLAARIEDPAGESLLRDRGAVGELAGAIASAVTDLIARMRRGFPNAEVVLQFSEPDLPAVLAGQVRTSSGRLTYRSLEPPIVQGLLRTVLDATTTAGALGGVRCARPQAPIQLFIDAGARFVSVNLDHDLPPGDSLPKAWEDGVGLLLGCVPIQSLEQHVVGDREVSSMLRTFMDKSGFGDVPENVALTPSGGLAHLDPARARIAIERCVRVGSIARDEHPEVVGG
jgi:hypothetical protein